MAMTKDELWAAYVKRNPHWLTGGASLSPDGLKRLFDQTFDLGHALGLENGKELAKSSGGGLFEELLGRVKSGMF